MAALRTYPLVPIKSSPVPELYASLPVVGEENRPLIRVLCLDPLPPEKRQRKHDEENPPFGDEPPPLAGTLQVVNLCERPHFTALSYTWGAPSTPAPTLSLRISGDEDQRSWELQITPNARDALCAIRKHFGGVTIWIDAICINQIDDYEKSTQLPRMAEIYTWARTTYVWMGRGSPDIDEDVLDMRLAADLTYHHCPAEFIDMDPTRSRWHLYIVYAYYFVRRVMH